MKTILKCDECNYTIEGSSQKMLMNKIMMWNHSKKTHPISAQRVMRMYETLPNNLYSTTYAAAGAPRFIKKTGI